MPNQRVKGVSLITYVAEEDLRAKKRGLKGLVCSYFSIKPLLVFEIRFN
jgi:hypothetical protein